MNTGASGRPGTSPRDLGPLAEAAGGPGPYGPPIEQPEDARARPDRRRAERVVGGVAALALGAAAAFVLLVVGVALARPLLGWQFVVVSGSSMEPAIDQGAVAVMEEVDAGDLVPGDIIMFRDPIDPRRSVTHRIAGAAPGGGFITRGDANSADDSASVPPENVRGRYIFELPVAGELVRWTSGTQAWIVVALVPAVALLAWEARTRLGGRRAAAEEGS